MMRLSMRHTSKGQALVVLLVFMVVSITITSAAVIMILVNSQATSKFEAGSSTAALTESGVEDALLRLLRNPSYTGETLTIGGGSVTVEVSGGEAKTIRSQTTAGVFAREVEVKAMATGNALSVTSWKEVY